jgi:uncharacterized cupin superfamily protein
VRLDDELQPLRQAIIAFKPDVAFNLLEEFSGQVVYDAHEEEFCLLIEGSVRLTDDTGSTLTFQAGDAFVVPGGFRGEWCNLTPVRKHYAIMNLKDKETRS